MMIYESFYDYLNTTLQLINNCMAILGDGDTLRASLCFFFFFFLLIKIKIKKIYIYIYMYN